ncbi:hypothetical protein BCR33DRAFT_845086 [Rhizoclosmatium globosum]|uniref:Chromate transporter n=1 Tax=Rhizoclosmatium globosum TaxID=329046 RepID=A0A1Y2D3J4_9FUNG|nr:hypothetical protein BCR33DRAFT_845086 [Rhizoclosmatium globosum]|eukprot:ORY53868.1 hypothetical protein BCR33DRAFT_845086 [Rhizoclosmatium globosum]
MAPTTLGQRVKEVIVYYSPLGCISFGGPQASIAILFDLFVIKKKWLSEEMFTELYAISNALPGPPSIQLGFTIALIRGGVIPAIVAFIVTCLPGAVVMGAIGYGVSQLGTTDALPTWVLYIERSLGAVSIALIAIAVKQLVSKLLVDKTTCTLAAVAAVVVINFTAVAWMIPFVMFCGGLITYIEAEAPKWIEKYKLKRAPPPETVTVEIQDEPEVPATPAPAEPETNDNRIYFSYTVKAGIILLVIFAGLLVFSAIVRSQNYNQPINLFTTFYFFLMGFALINIMPGPNYNFAAYCGALSFRESGWSATLGAFMAWIGIFLPGLLIKAGVLPIWRNYRELPVLRSIFKGLNSVAVGLIFAAIFILWNKAIALKDGKVASLGEYSGWTGVMIIAFLAMDTWKLQPWWAVGAGAIVGVLGWVMDGKP